MINPSTDDADLIMNPNTSDYNKIDAIKAAHMIQKENVLDRQQNRKFAISGKS